MPRTDYGAQLRKEKEERRRSAPMNSYEQDFFKAFRIYLDYMLTSSRQRDMHVIAYKRKLEADKKKRKIFKTGFQSSRFMKQMKK